MKRVNLFVFFLLAASTIYAQVTVVPAPRKGFEKRIREHIADHKVIDTHEHLMNPENIKNSGMLDFTLLFHHYADDDIKSSGMSKPEFNALLTEDLTVKQKWEKMGPYYDKSFNTTYNRVIPVVTRDLFGISEINSNTIEELSEKIRKAYDSDWFHHVLKEECNIAYILNDTRDRSFGDKSMFRYVRRFGYYTIDTKEDLEKIEKNRETSINSLEDLEKALNDEFAEAMEEEFLAVKVGVAYARPLNFEDVNKETAERVFNQLKHGTRKEIPFEEAKPLSDYMMHRTIELARKYNKPIQIHTGLQAGDGNYIENSNPTHLANLFLQYRDVNFILFHGGYPFGGELASLAKNFRNVYIDLCWLYIISPGFSERYLHEWLETVPANKIMGFGGDYHNVENVYGHLLFAKEVIGNVLTEKVKSRYFSEEEAKKIASMLLYENAVNFFKLNE